MKLDQLTATSPLDGRYRKKVEALSEYFSEWALMRYRVRVEALYLIALAEVEVVRRINSREKKLLINLFDQFDKKDAQRIKSIEKKINHDVKAVEYFVKTKLTGTSLEDIKEFVHFALTSEDVNNLAYSLMIKDCLRQVYLPQLDALIKAISDLVKIYKSVAMLGRTHGQPASPTTLGKELAVFSHRLNAQVKTLPQLTGKLNGAVGNYNAHQIAFPQVNWLKFSRRFIGSLGLEVNLVTTQIESHDTWAQTFHSLVRINNIILDFNRDLWQYISLNYLVQKTVKTEVGSSTMPHKVNPIDFENSEGNLGIANSLLNHLANKLSISRLQRDLSDSTVSRNIGVALSHSFLALGSTIKGLSKVTVNEPVISQDLSDHPEVVTEAIQVILRREGMRLPFEQLKQLTRGKKISLREIYQFVDSLKLPTKLKRELKKVRPKNYLGLASKLTELI